MNAGSSFIRQSLWSSIVVEDLDSGKNIRMNIIVELNFFLCKTKMGYVEETLKRMF